MTLHRIDDWFPNAQEAPRRVGLTVASEELSDSEAVRQRLSAAGGAGWLMAPSEVCRWAGGALPAGPILAAELAVSPSESLHLRQAGRGWQLWRYLEEPEGEDLAFDERYLSTEGRARLQYTVYWRAVDSGFDGIQIQRPFAARFVGWLDAGSEGDT